MTTKKNEIAEAPEPTVGRLVWYFDPKLAANANDGMGRGPYPALVLKKVKDDLGVRLTLKVEKWGSAAYYSFVQKEGASSLGTDEHYWRWPERV